ncbi:MAG: DNA-binding protein [Sulfuritalea sp.]|nr:DNA-binding protein [Sulfuritalea sp.]
MARETTLTQEQINAAADAIRADGGKPTARAVRERIGSGSMATILKFLQAWQGGQIKPAEQGVTLPPALQRALVDFIGQEVASARAGIEAELVTAQTALADLINESERQASTIELQAQALEASSAAQAEQAGRMGQLESDLARATDDAQQERLAAEAARTELAKALLRLEAMPRLERELDTLRADLADERQARTHAEQAAAVAIAEHKASERRAIELQERAARSEALVHELRQDGKALAIESKAHGKEVATLTGELATTRERLETMTRELAKTKKPTPTEKAKKPATTAKARS